jgi:hypothetical protein
MTISDETLIKKYGGTLEEAKERWKAEMRANARVGGLAKGNKGLRVLRLTNPEKFKEIQAKGAATRRNK